MCRWNDPFGVHSVCRRCVPRLPRRREAAPRDRFAAFDNVIGRLAGSVAWIPPAWMQPVTIPH
jgi:hypothetical protein